MTKRDDTNAVVGRWNRRGFLAALGGSVAGSIIAIPRNGQSKSASGPIEHSSIQDAIDSLPASGGEVYLSAGTYSVDQTIELRDGVSLRGVSRNATVLVPAADIDVLLLRGSNAEVSGIKIHDVNEKQISTHGIVLSGAHQCILADIIIAETANGFLADNRLNDDADVWENSLRNIHIHDTRGHGFMFQGQYHDNSHQNLFSNRCEGDGYVWETTGVDGGNRFIQCTALECAIGFRITTGQEIWLDQIIADTNRSSGFFINDGFEGRLFVGQLWTSTNGNNGVELSTQNGGTVEDVYISNLYAWQNEHFGFLTNGDGRVKRAVIDTVTVHDNEVGARFAAAEHADVWFKWLHSRNNADRGVDGDGGRGVNVRNASTSDEIDIHANALKRWQGVGLGRYPSGQPPVAINWNRGDIVENTADGTVWLKTPRNGEFVKLGS